MNLALTSEESHALKSILASLSERAHRAMTLNDLFQKWTLFAQKVQRGYDDSIYEYSNDLSVRDLLEEIMTKGPPSLREKLASQIQTSDAQFLEATKPVQKSPFSTRQRTPPWWEGRIPKKITGELKEDLGKLAPPC